MLAEQYRQDPELVADWSDEWTERALIWRRAVAEARQIDAQRVERDAAMARGRKG